MKHIYIKLCLVLALPAYLLLSGCDGENIKKKFNLVAEVNFNIDATNNTSYDQVEILDASAQADDFSKYKEDAISVNLDSVKYYTYYVDPNDNSLQINSAAIKIGSVGGSDEITLGEVQNLNLMGAFEAPNAAKLTFNADGVAKFSNLLMTNPYPAQIRIVGDVNGNVDFKLRAKFYFTFEAWIL
jgi:hypothetical protein